MVLKMDSRGQKNNTDNTTYHASAGINPATDTGIALYAIVCPYQDNPSPIIVYPLNTKMNSTDTTPPTLSVFIMLPY